MEGRDLVSAPTSIPFRSQSRSTAQRPAKRPRPSPLHSANRTVSAPNPYSQAPLIGSSSSGQSSSSLTPDTQSRPTSMSRLSLFPRSPEPPKVVASLESVKEPEPMPFTFACPTVKPAKVRFPLIDSPEPDSPKNQDATPAPLLLTNGNTVEDDETPVYDYETEEDNIVQEHQSEHSIVVPGVVPGGQPGPVQQAPEQPSPQEAEIVGIPATVIPKISGQNARFSKTRDEYVRYLVDLFRKYEFEHGCTTPAWLEKYPAIKQAAQAVADKVYGIQEAEKKEDKEESNEDKEKEKAKEECQAQGHQPTPTEPSPPQSSFNNAGHGGKGRKLVTRFFRKIKNLFKKNEPASQVFEMAEIAQVQTNVQKGKERETVTTQPTPTPKMEVTAEGIEDVVNGYFVKIVPATYTRRSRLEYREEEGETSAEGARKNCRTAREDTDSESLIASFERRHSRN
ncbi:uncharacterized protein GGS22DRAFT_13281 [Annulohypoxylon maeteangense]|uniref:uncharacterized protein n=1 Tax=Annulohypoxylon maeteangense TaxID=1927788 RepID=UPI002007E047|nr:uncharacterized protein GGS22DRAFT_13281 [Annulohypoxylon maeteangense]KAI0890408.1 hypothetical protein GGS22DRAFT_13281 [Annulohypoxylon maeteangense]